MSGKGLSCGDRRDLAVEVAELHEATWIDVHRKGVFHAAATTALPSNIQTARSISNAGVASGLRHRLGRTPPDKVKLKPSERMEQAQQLVKDVMGTSGGDNARLVKMIHQRFDAVGLKQPAVEVRFAGLTAQSMVPASAAGGGLFTVGADLKAKARKGVAVVTRKKQPMKSVRILQNMTGTFRPGTITLLVGPPGGGKSMLMKALCGAAPVATSGKITYNGHDLDEFNVVRTAQYVAQHNLLNSELTVTETLMFSAMCQGPGYNPGLLELLEKREQKQGIEPEPQLAQLMKGLHSTNPATNVALTLQLLALTDCADTVVGDGMTRGISGGERKRVTSGEVMVGPSKVLFMDEISTGLDSASTFTIVQSLANWAHATDATIVVALLQPEPQVYELFDEVMLVANGRITYHGPRTSVLSYFAELGFVPPPKKAVADFLQEVVSKKDQPLLRLHVDRFEPQLEFVHPAALATAFTQSRMLRRTLDLQATPFDKSTSHPAALLKSMYGVPKREHLKALLWRETVLISRNSKATTYRHIQMAWLACMVATGFLRGEVTNTDTVRGSANGLAALFFSMAYMQFLGLAECAETMMRLPVFYKQKYNLLFPGWTYAVPFATIHIPRAVLEVTMWSLVVYWGVGFEADAARFFCFWGTLVSMQLYSGSLYRMLGTTLRSLVFGTSAAVVIMLMTFLGSGFLILRDQLPPWWKWLFWVSPLQYALTGLANNEFLGPSYDRIVEVNGEDLRFGDVVLDQYQFMKGNKWRILAPVVLLSWYVILTLINALALSRVPPPRMPPPAHPPEEPEYTLKAPQLMGQQSAKPQAANGNSTDMYVTCGNPLFGPDGAITPTGSTPSASTPLNENSHFLSALLPTDSFAEAELSTVKHSAPVMCNRPSMGGSGAPPGAQPGAPPGPIAEGDAARSSEDSQEDSDAHSAKREAVGDAKSGLTPPEDTVVPIPVRKSNDLPKTSGPQLSFPFEPITLAFKDLKYYVPAPDGKGELQLLKSISGVFRPGVLTALMGASGAGKTTLMDVLADRKTAGRAEGKVTVNGYDKKADTFARVMGYCEQFDVHSPGLTVAESVRLSAELRLAPSVSPEDKEKFVQQTLEVVELDPIGGHPVGLPGLFGLSGEQFKRLTIAVELVANPSILFMDEPTSGLDARAAQIVMRVVRAIGNNRRTIVCTIHQPSAEIFLNFDELLLLKRGGHQIFYGPLGKDSTNLVEYFQSVPNAIQLSQGYNPATYMLEATTRSEEERLGVDFAEVWQKRQRASVLQAVEPFMTPVDTAQQLQFTDRYAQSRFFQYRVLFGRYFKAYWRSPPYNTTRLILALIAALLLGTFYFSRGDKYDTPTDLLSVLGALLISVMFVGFINFQMIIPTFYMERPVMWRERASAMYAVLPWVESMQDVEIPWVALQVSLFSIVAYFMIGFELHAGKFFFYWLALNLSCLSMVYFGMLVVCITPNMHMGITAGATILGMWFVFAGFMIPRPEIPLWWRWFSYLCPPGWTLQAIISSQLGDKEDRLTGDFDVNGVDRQRTLREFIEDEYGFEYSFRWPALGIMLLFVVAMRLTVAFTTKTLHWQKR